MVKFRGGGQVAVSLYRGLGAGLAIAAMEALASLAGEPVSRLPFVTSIVLVTALPDSDAAQPRAVIGGHLVSSLAGLVCQAVIGSDETAGALAVGLATFAMLITRTLHPPAGIDAFLVPINDLGLRWLASPVLVGAVMLAAYGRLWAAGERRFVREPASTLG